METHKKTLSIIQKTFALENPPRVEDHFFEDLNAHPEDMERLRNQLNAVFQIELGEESMQDLGTVANLITLVKDHTDDIT